MKIKKQPVVGVHTFVCRCCETEFDAWESEYSVSNFDKQVEIRSFGFLGNRTMGTYEPTWVLTCGCPVCKEQAEIEFPKGERYEKEVFNDISF